MKILHKTWKLSLIVILFWFCSCMSTPVEEAKNKKVEITDISQYKQTGKVEAGLYRALISNNIHSISADKNSVWIATDRGISKLDRNSNTWTHYTKDDGLGSDSVSVVVSEGRWVWFGTDNGVTLYDTNLRTWRTFNEKDGLRSGMVKSIAIEGNYVWVGTEGGGLNRYDRNTDSWASRTRKDGLSNDGVNAIAIDSKYVWVGTHHGVNRYDKITDSWNRYFKQDGLVENSVWTIGIADNFVWFGSPWDGISVYDVTNQAFMRTYTKTDLLASNEIRSIVIDGNNIWIGAANSGVQRYIESVNTWVQYTQDDGLASNHITHIAAYRNEIWCGTYDSGVSMYDKVKNRWTTYVEVDSPPEDDVKEIARDSSGHLWAATSGGLLEYNPQNNEWTRYGKKNGLATNFITAVIADEDNIWVGTARGLASYNIMDRRWRFYNRPDGISEDFITALAVTSDKNRKTLGLSAGLSVGLSRNVSKPAEGISKPANRIETLWVGTNRGLFSCQIEGQAPVGKFVASAKFEQNRITAIASEGDFIWIGTTAGVFQYNLANQKVTLHNIEHGLSDNYVNSILVLDNRVWVGTRNGISVYDQNSKTWQTLGLSAGLSVGLSRNVSKPAKGVSKPAKRIETINISDKLPCRNVRALMASQNGRSIWVGTSAGLAKYDMQRDTLAVIDGSMNDEVLGSLSIKSIASVTDDILWLGTTSGVIEYQISSGDFREYRAFVTRHPLREQSIANIEFDGDTIWFSNWADSHNGAIIKYNRHNDTWQRFTRETILSDTKVKAPTRIKRICIDDKWVWFATDYGVLQYDKFEDTWRHFTTKDGLLSNNIRTVAPGDNVVWVCPEERTRINKYDKNTGKWSEIKLSRLIHPRNYIYDMKADGDSVWLSISSSGVRKISEDDEETVYMKEHGLAQTGARWIEVDENYVWVAHWKGRGSGTLSRYDKKNSEWKVYSKGDVLENDEISKIIIGQKYTWIIYDAWQEGSVTGFDGQTGEWTTIKPQEGWGSEVKELCEDGPYLWLAMEIGGIKRFHMASGTWTSFNEGNGLLMNYINDRALKADERYLWVGTPKGIARYDKQRESWTNYTKKGTLEGNRIQAVAADERYVWCGTSEGISRYDKVYGRWETLQRPWGTVKNVSALAIDDRYLWIGTRRGAFRYDKITDKWDGFRIWNGLPGEDISAVVVDGYDVWMGTNGGICKFPRMSDNLNDWVSYTSGASITSEIMSKEYAATLVSNEVWCMDADKNDIWVGTMRGVSRYNKGKDLWTTYTTKSGLPSNEISSLCIDVENPAPILGTGLDGGDAVWFGSNNGVTRYDKKTGKWTTYTANDELASNKITCIAKNKDAIWFGTFDAGVMQYDKKTRKWQAYQRDDGLAHDCVLSIAVDNEKLWLGTPWGLSRYDPVTNSFTTYTEHDDPEDILAMVISSKDELRPEDVYAGPVIGNKKSNKYHYPDSSPAKSILKENRMYFDSVEKAETAGYERAGNFKVD